MRTIKARLAFAQPGPRGALSMPAAGTVRSAVHRTVRAVLPLCTAATARAAEVARAAAVTGHFITAPATPAVDSRVANSVAPGAVPMVNAAIAALARVPRLTETLSLTAAAVGAAAHLCRAVLSALPPVRVRAIAIRAHALPLTVAGAVAVTRLYVAAHSLAAVPIVARQTAAAVLATEVADAVAAARAGAETPAGAARARAGLIREPAPDHQHHHQHQRDDKGGRGRQALVLLRRRRLLRGL